MAGTTAAAEAEVREVYSQLSIDEEEEVGLVFKEDEIQAEKGAKLNLQFCLVGSFLTDKAINFPAMKNTMAALWRPGKGICIKDLSPTLFLFQFFHEVDIQRVLDSGPWTFDQHLLIMKRLSTDEQPQSVSLFHTSFWIQVYNLPIGFLTAKVLQNIGPLEGGEPLVGSCVTSGGSRVISETNPTIPDISIYNDSAGMEVNGNKELHMAVVVGKPTHSQRIAKGKDVEHAYNEDDLLKEGVFEFGQGMIVKETKRRRAQLGLEFTGGTEVDGPSNLMNIDVDPKNGLAVKLLKYGRTFIDVEVSNSEMGVWRVTGFYGYPESNRRRESWHLLRRLASLSTLPWVCLGDFNDLLDSSEKNGSRPHAAWKIHGFRSAISDAGLSDLGMVGYQFTWERGRGTVNWVEERLDRAFSSSSWRDKFPNAQVQSMEADSSDHLPIFLDPIHNFHSASRVSRFRFENLWLREADCEQIVRCSWDDTTDLLIQQKLSVCGLKLMNWGGHMVRDFRSRLKEYKTRMRTLRGRRDMVGLIEFTEVRKRYNELLHSHEIFWKQRAKALWLKEGDLNSRYFHSMASTRKKKNSIVKLRNAQGVWCADSGEIDTLIRTYFTELFSSNGSNSEAVISSVMTSITAEQNQILLAPFTDADVKEALFSMHPDKSPGPDGMNPAFYQKFWHIVGGDVSAACLYFIANKQFPLDLNKTFIVLIPKKAQPEVLADMRPIALCNVLYKIIAKMLANRLKLVLDSVIFDSQSAFVPGRAITDNILISAEIMHFLKRKRQGKKGVAALKIDMAKAYDRVEWDFLRAMMSKMGFADEWVHLVMLCVTTVSYSVLREGNEVGLIIPRRGLRQGDPLSPYLFLLCAEGFSSLIAKYEKAGLIHGVQVARKAPAISHLLFADDCFLFFRANQVEANLVKQVLCAYGNASGQCVNYAKSSISFSMNVNEDTAQQICTTLGEKVWKKLQGWNKQFLSRAGKEILLKTVAQAVPNFVMNIYLLPLELCKELEIMMNSFWWGNSRNHGRGINWMRWDALCKPKSAGGIGFKKLHAFNLAMLGKQGWKLMTKPNSLVAQILKARYYSRTSFAGATLGHNPSYAWRSIMAAKQVVIEGSRIRIGDGEQTFIGKDPWLPDSECGFINTLLSEQVKAAQVSSLMVPSTRTWDSDILNDIFNERDKNLIWQIPLSNRSNADSWYWMHEAKGVYTVRSSYKMLAPCLDIPSSSIWNQLWRLEVPSKVKHFMWRALTDVLPTTENLLKKYVEVPPACITCHASSESICHILLQCPFARTCWMTSSIGFFGDGSNLLLWLEALFNRYSLEQTQLAVMICWSLWQNRNAMVWRGKTSGVQQLLNSAGHFLFQWQSVRKHQFLFSQPSPIGHGAICWEPPLAGRLKCNVDAAMFASRGYIGLGNVIRDSNGAFVAARCCSIPGRFSARDAEALGVREALSWIKQLQLSNVTIEMDSLNVYNALVTNLSGPSSFSLIIEDCRALSNSIRDVSFSFVRRSANSVAHSVAQAGNSLSGHGEWRAVPPPFLIADLFGSSS
ncbi:reverse transcriptase domain-containing protein [Citrus sinensis]|uniref:Reverse transcriptase domain-containing protein n=1 Tax=Citrus sinensis TaxID=2711 RepID=A0ACB8K7U4_CITSI|nr:reverse transcriptase domain-containing protein [Citrus sinensis]